MEANSKVLAVRVPGGVFHHGVSALGVTAGAGFSLSA